MTKTKTINLAIFGVVLLAGFFYTLFQGADLLAMKGFSYLGITSRMNIWLIIVIAVFMLLTIVFTRKNSVSQTAIALLLAGAQIIFLYWIYYGFLTIYIVQKTGVDPRLIIFLQTLFIIVMAGIIYYGCLYVYGEKPMVWKTYMLISVFGPIIIGTFMYLQPYNLFAHEAVRPNSIQSEAKTNTAQVNYGKEDSESFESEKINGYTVLTSTEDPSRVFIKDGKHLVQIKHWILRDKDGKIIDLKYSPGASQTYGLMMRPSTPDDVDDVKKFLGINSKIPVIYDEKPASQANSGTEGGELVWTEVYRQPFTGVGFTGGDDPDNDGSIYTAEHGKDILVGDRYTVTDTNFEVWVKGDWHKFPKGHWLPSEEIQPGNNVTFRNDRGIKFTVVVERSLKKT